MIDCAEAVRRMWAFIDEGLHEHAEFEFAEHLATCRRCCGELEFHRHLRARVAAADRAATMPDEARARIEALLEDIEVVAR
jgi:anti-sigma factor (TIGR02949 family)